MKSIYDLNYIMATDEEQPSFHRSMLHVNSKNSNFKDRPTLISWLDMCNLLREFKDIDCSVLFCSSEGVPFITSRNKICFYK